MSAISAIKKALEDGFARGDEESLVAFHQALLQGELLVAAIGEVELPVVLAGETVYGKTIWSPAQEICGKLVKGPTGALYRSEGMFETWRRARHRGTADRRSVHR